MSLAVFDVTPSYARVGDLFDTAKKYVYRDPNSGGTYVREPPSGESYSGTRYWSADTGTPLTYAPRSLAFFDGLTGPPQGSAYGATSVQSGIYTLYRGSLMNVTSYDVGDESGSYTGYIYSYAIYRVQAVNPSVIRMPLGKTIEVSGSALTYSFDGDTYAINSQLSVGGGIIYLGII